MDAISRTTYTGELAGQHVNSSQWSGGENNDPMNRFDAYFHCCAAQHQWSVISDERLAIHHQYHSINRASSVNINDSDRLESLKDVSEAISGFNGGTAENPTYRGNHTEHCEAVEITYDPSIISDEELLQHFRVNIHPIDAQGQFCDKGPNSTSRR